MRTECGIIQDLLPLYADGVCSPESKAAIEQHLEECSECRETYQRAFRTVPDSPELEPDAVEEGKEFRHGLRKVRRRWIYSLIAALLAVPLVFMSIAQITGDGICFSNLGQIMGGRHFLSLLKKGAYGEAFDMLDSESTWEDLTDYEKYRGEGVKTEEYQAIEVDGKIWMFSPTEMAKYFNGIPDALEGEAALDFWETICQHTQSNNTHFIIPAEAYDKLKSEGWLGDGSFDREEDRKIQRPIRVRNLEGDSYCIGTMSDVGQDPYTDERDLDSYYYEFACVPEWIWKKMEEREQQDKEAFEKRAEQYLSIGYEGWREKSREQFIDGMEEWEEEYGRVAGILFHSAYYNEGGDSALGPRSGVWQLDFSLRFSEEESGGEGITLAVTKGKIRLKGGYYRSDDSIVSRFLNALSEADFYTLPYAEE
ncbi:zf-HC2 domain-containing protein [Lacrimispora sp. NSJ-141]|uniref:Anti-sigma-W factor RsiW n=1 Tax=Lientehia hominis TaxID=2897778 RepID=A0AAP2RJM6_9FIRM|nr:zf-HC2 domain-containing protein [Lientehia hominis]MCD2492891.1 zf-HC2 domain-containing protein [Lientehia hominis]